MKYSNPDIPEGINTSQTHPLKEFAVLSVGMIVVLFVALFILGWLGGALARYIPFEAEIAVTQPYTVADTAEDSPLQTYLHNLTERVTQAMDLPQPLRIQLHYVDDDLVNAFATLGGHVMLFRGLLEKLPHENALVMLMAHEFAHVKHRDPIVGLGSGIAITVGQAALLGNSSSNILGKTGLLTTLHFSRDMESNADHEALLTLHKIYGHVSGATDLFHLFLNERSELGMYEPPAFLSSHPLDEVRIQVIEDFAQQQNWVTNQTTTPLPIAFQQWLQSGEIAEGE